MSEDGVKKQDDLSDVRAQVGSQQTQSDQVVDLAEIQSKKRSRKVTITHTEDVDGSGGGVLYLPNFPIMGDDNRIGSFGNSSVQPQNLLTVEVEWNETYRTDQSGLGVGQYAVDYDDGTLAYNINTPGTLIVVYAIVVQSLSDINTTLTMIESGSYTYVLLAPIGADENNPVWQAKRIDESVSGTMKIKWADGNDNFDNIAANYASLTYL